MVLGMSPEIIRDLDGGTGRVWTYTEVKMMDVGGGHKHHDGIIGKECTYVEGENGRVNNMSYRWMKMGTFPTACMSRDPN